MRFRLGFRHAFGVKSDGLSGSLVLFWNNDSVVTLKSYSRTRIDVFVQNDATGNREWRFTGFYGEPVRSRRKKSWELLMFHRNQYDHPWLCAGDFNEILDANQQFGGAQREEWKMEGFRDAVNYCRFSDLGYTGLPCTWDNRQDGNRNIKVRLDRGLGDDRFMEMFDNSSVTHVQTTKPDHCALMIGISKSD